MHLFCLFVSGGAGALYCVSDLTQTAVQVLTLPVGESSAMVTAGESHVAATGVMQHGKGEIFTDLFFV